MIRLELTSAGQETCSFGFLWSLQIVESGRNSSSTQQLERTARGKLSVMDQIIAANYHRNSNLGFAENFKRDKIGEEILKTNDAQHTAENLFEGDILTDPTDPEDMKLIKLQEETKQKTPSSVIRKRQASRKLKWLWHSKQIPYVISSELNSVRYKILKAIDTFNKKTCVQFVPKRGYERNYVLYAKKQGCYSRIGKSYSRSGPQIISIGDFCDAEGIIIHEMLHAVGFYHEQSRPDRAKNVEILWENIRPGLEDQFLKYGHGDIDGLGVNYNYRSIMHYGRNAFSKNSNLNTLQAIGDSKIELGNTDMSPEDMIELDALYRCKTNDFNSWTAWSSYSPCDSRCYRNRQRFCYGRTTNACGGKPNRYGIEKVYVKCSAQDCPAKIDGHWGAWSRWGKCSRRCNEGVQVRKRPCNNPAPQNNGKKCKDSGKEQIMCIQPRCALARSDTDFRNRNLGIWKNDIYDTPTFDWRIGKGDTNTEGTGPHADHTTKEDYYLYIESSGRKSNDNARLISKTLPKTRPGKKCLKFFYHMYGRTTGSLSVRLFAPGQTARRIFYKNGDQGREWNAAFVNLHSSVPYQLVFEATVGRPTYSDIAIDDVFIDNGGCDCQDKYMVCKSWRKRGYCKKSFIFMHQYCPKSCNFCGCRNSEKWNCNQWSKKECKKNPMWMEVYCPVLCQVCDCYDKSIFCLLWKILGECKRNPKYMREYCRKSCEICS